MLSIKVPDMAALDTFKTYTSELAWLTALFGIVWLCTAVNATGENSEGKFSSFVINVERVTAANKQCEQTVLEYKQTIGNLTQKMETQEARIQDLEATTRKLNGRNLYSTFSNPQLYGTKKY